MSVASVTGREPVALRRERRPFPPAPIGVSSEVGTQFVAKLVRHGNDILRWQGPAAA